MQAFFARVVARRWLVLVLALAGIAGGWLNLRGLAIDAVPDISPKQVLILTEANGLGPLEVEKLVTAPIEMQMAGLPGMTTLRSKSRFGLSAVYVTFRDDADVTVGRERVFQRLQQARRMMPSGVGTPEEGPLTTGLGEILEFELRGPGFTPMQLYQILQWQVVPQLRLVPGIVNVDIYGGQLETFEVRVDPDRLRAAGVSLPQLFAAIEGNNAARGGAYIEHGDEQEVVRGLALAQGRADIAAIVLRIAPGGIPVTVADVGDVVMAPRVRFGAVTHDGEGETLVGVAEMQYGLNSSAVLPGLKAALARVERQLPPGVGIHVFYDRSGLVDRAIDTVAHNLVEGAVLVVAVLLLMLGNLRAGLVTALVIPLSMMIAFAGMRIFGIPANLMSLGAIDFGLVVDGAVVLVENVLRRQEGEACGGETSPAGDASTGRDGFPGLGGDGGGAAAAEDTRRSGLLEVVPRAASEVARPVIFAVAIICLTYLPVMSLSDIEGKTFRPMAETVMLALGGSLLVTLLVVPALAATFLSGTPARGETILVRWARRAHAPALRLTGEHPWLTLGVAALLSAGAVWLATGLGAEFIPTLQEGAIVVTSNKLPSINLDASLRVVNRIERTIRTVPEVRTVVSQTGSAAVPTDPMGVQSTDSYVILTPPGTWKHGRTQSEIRDEIERKVKAAIPGVAFEFSQPIEMRMDDLLQGVRSQVALAIYGPDLGELQHLAGQAAGIVRAVRGAADVRAEQEGGLPDLTVRVDRGRLARFGASASDVLAVVEAIGGRVVGTVYGEDNRETPIEVRIASAGRASVARVSDLPVGVAGGGAGDATVPLSAVADVSVAPGPAQIEREALERRIAVQINVRGRDVNGFATAAEKAVSQKLHLPQGYRVEWSGEFQNLRSASARLTLVVPAVLAVIFLLLYLNFGSLRVAGLIFLNVPMAATGGIAALVLRGMPFSVSAAIGFISTFGIAILDGVVLASYIGEERADGAGPEEAARDAAGKRLRPVLTTALVASIGFVPMAVATGTGSEVQRPLATVVIGGLVSATLLTLLVLPSLYPVVMQAKIPSWRRISEVLRWMRLGGRMP